MDDFQQYRITNFFHKNPEKQFSKKKGIVTNVNNWRQRENWKFKMHLWKTCLFKDLSIVLILAKTIIKNYQICKIWTNSQKTRHHFSVKMFTVSYKQIYHNREQSFLWNMLFNQLVPSLNLSFRMLFSGYFSLWKSDLFTTFCYYLLGLTHHNIFKKLKKTKTTHTHTKKKNPRKCYQSYHFHLQVKKEFSCHFPVHNCDILFMSVNFVFFCKNSNCTIN